MKENATKIQYQEPQLKDLCPAMALGAFCGTGSGADTACSSGSSPSGGNNCDAGTGPRNNVCLTGSTGFGMCSGGSGA